MIQPKVKRLTIWLLGLLSFIIIIISASLVYNTVRSSIREASSIEELAPTTGKFIIADCVKVFTQEQGPADGVPVILIHGTGSWSEIWRETMEELAENGYRAIAIDIPPFGFSQKLVGSTQFTTEKQGQRLNSVLSELNIEGGVLVGHSVGGRPTLEAMLNNQKRIDKLVLVDVALGFSPDSLKPQFAQNDPGFLLKSISLIKPLRNSLFKSIGTNPYFTKPQLEAFVYNKAAIKPSHIKMLQKPLLIKGTSISNADWFEYLTISSPHTALSTNFEMFKSIVIPTLIIWGSKDDITPLWQGKYLTNLFSNSRLEIMKDVGHIPYIENTEKFNELLISFLNQEF